MHEDHAVGFVCMRNVYAHVLPCVMFEETNNCIHKYALTRGFPQAEASKVLELCAREATMIFGGNALMLGGVGDKIECSVAQVKA